MELHGRILLDGRLQVGRLRIEGERVHSIHCEPLPSGGAGLPCIVPGFVDLHVHGFGGAEPLTKLSAMAEALARVGTTAFQPTLFPREPIALGRDCERVEAARRGLGPGARARVLGLHLEGPFVNPTAAGALPPEDLAVPSPAALRAILGPASGDGRGVRTMTVAPELPGAAALVAELLRSGVRVSLGHSRASASQARSAVRAGATGATHLYNAMSGLHHREAGLVGTALTSPTLQAEIIGDLAHVGAEAFQVALAARGAAGLALVSDALEGAGTGCDRFHGRGRAHQVIDGAFYYSGEGAGGEPRLAGSASSQLDMVRKLVARGVLALEEALQLASTTPARALGLEHELGRIAPGAFADLLVLEGEALALRRVLVGGRDVPLG